MPDHDPRAPGTERAAAPAVPAGFVRGVAAVLGIVTAVLGAWALLAPRSFYDVVATFPPYNRHLIHDVGAFQLGIGATLLLALRWRDGLAVALGGYAVGAIVHTASHLVDSGLGGRPAFDIPGLTALAALAVVALVLRGRRTGSR
jgi:hypothetical protein